MIELFIGGEGMAGYTAIADIGNALTELLRFKMVPDVFLNEESIGVCSPEDKGDFMLGIYLYDVRQSEIFRSNEMQTIDSRRQKFPSTYLELYYMLTAYSNGDVKFRSLEEHKILGKVIQIFLDNSSLDATTLKPVLKTDEFSVRLELLPLSLEEKMKIWAFPNRPYKLSLFLKVAPVEIESLRVKEVQRVMDIQFFVKEQRSDG